MMNHCPLAQSWSQLCLALHPSSVPLQNRTEMIRWNDIRWEQGDAETSVWSSGHDSTSVLVSERVLRLTEDDGGSGCSTQIENAAQSGSAGWFLLLLFSACIQAVLLFFPVLMAGILHVRMSQRCSLPVNDLDHGLLDCKLPLQLGNSDSLSNMFSCNSLVNTFQSNNAPTVGLFFDLYELGLCC